MKAIIIGATGATGKDLVHALLRDPDYTEVVTLIRRSSGLRHQKYVEVITDFEKLGEVSDIIRGDVWFSCLGTTRKAAGSREKQWCIDYDIPLKFAEIARRNGIPKAVLLSAYGASASSRVFYSRLKGSLDAAVIKLGFDSCLIFRPGFLLRRDTDRPGERLIAHALKFVNRLSLLKKFRPMPTSILAEKLAEAPKNCGSGTRILELDEIFSM